MTAALIRTLLALVMQLVAVIAGVAIGETRIEPGVVSSGGWPTTCGWPGMPSILSMRASSGTTA